MECDMGLFGIVLLSVLGTAYAQEGTTPSTESDASASATVSGTWNVTSTHTGISTCSFGTAGDQQASIWIVSAAASGDLKVSVQGDTGFPTLRGRAIA